MSDDERANIGRARRTPARGYPVHVEDEEGRTPITDVLALAQTPDERELLIRIWRHIANVETRSRTHVDSTESGKLREDLDAVELAIVDIHGVKGSNGKLGELRRRVDALTKRAWSIVTLAIGGIGAAAIKLVIVTRAFDATEYRAQQNERQIQILQAQVTALQTLHLTRRLIERNQP